MKINYVFVPLLLTLNYDFVELQKDFFSEHNDPWQWAQLSRQMYHEYQDEVDMGMCMVTKLWKVVQFIETSPPHDPEVTVKLVSLNRSLESARKTMENSTWTPTNSSEVTELASLGAGTSGDSTRIARTIVREKKDLSSIGARGLEESSLEAVLMERGRDFFIIRILINVLHGLVYVVQSTGTLVKSSIILSCLWDYVHSKVIIWINSYPGIY